MKRLLFGLAFAGGIVVSLAGTKQLVPADVVRDEVSARLSRIVGRPVLLAGRAEISLFPSLSVEFHDARLNPLDGGAPIAEATELAVRIDVLPLLIGRLSLDGIELIEPKMDLETSLAAADLLPGRATLSAVEPVRLTIDRGRLTLRDPKGGTETFEDIAASVIWPRAKSTASLETTFRWRGEAVAVAWQGLGPRALVEGETGPATLTATAGPLRIGFDGKGVLADRLQLDGALKVTSPDLPRAAAWLGLAAGGVAFGRNFALEGRMRSLGLAATVSDGRIESDGNRAEGVLSVRLDAPRPQIRGTLAFDLVELDRLRPTAGAGDWRSIGLDRAILTAMDLDLRLSAAKARLGPVLLDGVAATLLVKDGRFDAEIGEAGLLGGRARMVLRGEAKPEGVKIGGRLVAADLLATTFGAVGGVGGLDEGRLGFVVEGETIGFTAGAMVDAFSGRFHAEGRQLTLRAGRTSSQAPSGFLPIALKPNVTAKSATFEQAVVDADLVASRARIRRVEAKGAALQARLSGEAWLTSGQLSLTGELSVPASGEPGKAGSTRPSAPVPVWVGGTIFAPVAVVAPEATAGP